MRSVLLSDWLQVPLQRGGSEPVYRQLHNLLLQAVLQGRLPAGTKLPSTRLLAEELGVARNTIIAVYEHLGAQGCLRSRHGSGTYVADLAIDHMERPSRASTARRQARGSAHAAPRLSARGREVVEGIGFSSRQWGAFMPGVPDVTEFPARLWARLHNRHWRSAPPEQLSYAPAGGLPALRSALAEHLRTARSVQCQPEQVIITTGIHQSVDLAVRLLADPGDRIWVEEPCYWGLRSELKSLDLILEPVPVDAEGLRLSPARLKRPAPRFVLVTPSHQYPLGMVMSLKRRQALLEYCRRNGTWIIEDDYDSEFRYSTRPIACLQGLDTSGLVHYVGSFSKMLFPGLRIGFLVVPPLLAETFAKASAELFREGQLQQQAMLADFINEGHLSSHIRRLRGLYSPRRERLLEAIRSHFGDRVSISGDYAGLHLVLYLPQNVDDNAVVLDAAAAGVVVRSLSRYYSLRASARRGLLLGYACVKEPDIAPAFEILARVLRVHGVK
jgi:GntR family transcriptional regulator / MocR family aminotransferase